MTSVDEHREPAGAPATRAKRLRRGERKAQNRDQILEAARAVFFDQGFHGASLDEIAEVAGFTKGAVYSNFRGKDDLFLEVLAEKIHRHVQMYTDAMGSDVAFETTIRGAARGMVEAITREPAWLPLLVEFWTHAARDRELKDVVLDRHERGLEALANLLEEVATNSGLTYAAPVLEVARSAGALYRGIALERLINPSAFPVEQAEQMLVALIEGQLAQSHSVSA